MGYPKQPGQDAEAAKRTAERLLVVLQENEAMRVELTWAHDFSAGTSLCEECSKVRHERLFNREGYKPDRTWLRAEVERRKRLQPIDRYDRPITQSMANGMMAEIDRLSGKLASVRHDLADAETRADDWEKSQASTFSTNRTLAAEVERLSAALRDIADEYSALCDRAAIGNDDHREIAALQRVNDADR